MRLNRGSDLQTVLDEIGMQQVQLARLVGVTPAMIHHLIKGTRGCKAVTAMLIVDALRRNGKPNLAIGDLFLDRIDPVSVATPQSNVTALDVA